MHDTTHNALIDANESKVRKLTSTADGDLTPPLVGAEVMAALLCKSRHWLDRRAMNGTDPSIRVGRSRLYDWRSVLAMAARGELR